MNNTFVLKVFKVVIKIIIIGNIIATMRYNLK